MIEIPIKKENGLDKDYDYISLRYMNDDIVEDSQFSSWLIEFKNVLQWLTMNSTSIEVNN